MSNFSKRHYEIVAHVLSEQRPNINTDTTTFDRMVRGFVSAFERDNPNFKLAKFLEAVYGKP